MRIPSTSTSERALFRSGGARREYGVVVVADITLAYQQTRKIFQRIFAVGDVDRLRHLVSSDTFDGRRNAVVDSDVGRVAATVTMPSSRVAHRPRRH